MNELNILRKMAEQQQHGPLKEMAESLYQQTENPAILPLLATACAHLGLKQQTEIRYEQAFESLAELDCDGRCDLAAVLIVMQRLEQANSMLTEILIEQPMHALAYARLGYCCLLQDNLSSAQQHFEQSLALQPSRLVVHGNLLNLYLNQAHYQQAQGQLDEAFEQLEQQYDELLTGIYQQYWLQFNTVQLQLWLKNEDFAQAEDWLQQLCEQQQAGECEEALFIHCLKQYSRLLAESDLHQQASDILREYFKQYSGNSDLCLTLSELAQVQGHFMQAVNLLQNALKNDDQNINLWVQLSSACVHRFDQKARKAAEKAVALAQALTETPEQPLAEIKWLRAQASNVLAQVESQEQNFDLSEKLYRDILTEHAHFLPALQGLAQQLMQQGHIDEALELFERVKQIDPIKGHSALINARRFPEDVETLDKMAAAAKQPSIEGSLKAGILFQLASAWEKRKEFDKAFGFANQANAASKQFLPYDGKAHRKQCARLRHAFCKPLFEHRKDSGIDSNVPVYVLGMPRSGTTLVEQILSGHSDIFGAGELGVIPQVVQGLSRWERHVGSGRSYPDCIDDINAYTSSGIANNVLTELIELAAEEKPDAKHIVDKLPHNFENIGLIKFLFPNAKIISVRRDPRDIAISNYFTDYQAKHGGMGFAYDLETIGEQLADHNLLMHHWQQTFPGEILEVNYEDVVDDLEGSARKMLDYIGVQWQPQVLKFNELERTVKTASVWQVRQPIYKTSKAKWKRYKNHLQPLIKGTNAKIIAPPIDDMLTLPKAGFLTEGVALYKENDLDGAELNFKKMLHHNPEHAACNYMLGLVYLSKNHFDDGIVLLEKALEKAPWHKEWRDNLIKAYQLNGETEKVQALQAAQDPQAADSQIDNNDFAVPNSL
ncbi:sulfotransferase containing TPR domain [Psychromonas ingrahamii 37]|uniref:Sulfotransferase containing TPR domain n=1 Tax=Psychromonas ingrahamii (strain DSM 17664 / CCUG 51855 / 37) TaxID=357804 RepID=A1SYI7_PSYIN|nr:tetratricopeptide repeat-containing sulfotransferase family protein [Psychromonas ingrahamii]ABM04552.1 sulfotransferase containing TPR domain [Psychromonas ingrahamii 37]